MNKIVYRILIVTLLCSLCSHKILADISIGSSDHPDYAIFAERNDGWNNTYDFKISYSYYPIGSLIAGHRIGFQLYKMNNDGTGLTDTGKRDELTEVLMYDTDLENCPKLHCLSSTYWFHLQYVKNEDGAAMHKNGNCERSKIAIQSTYIYIAEVKIGKLVIIAGNADKCPIVRITMIPLAIELDTEASKCCSVKQTNAVDRNTVDRYVEVYVDGKYIGKQQKNKILFPGISMAPSDIQVTPKSGYINAGVTISGSTYRVNLVKKYTVKFNGNGSTSGSMSDQPFTYGTAQALTANAFKKEYTVTFNGNGGTSGASSLTSSATFNGWEDRSSITYDGTVYDYTQFDAPFYANTHTDVDSVLIKPVYSGNLVYDKYILVGHYHQWGKIDGHTPKGEQPGLYPNGATVNNLTTTANGTVPLYANWSAQPAVTLPNATRAGFDFDGWYTAATGGSFVGKAGASYTPTSNVTLYGHYTPSKADITIKASGLGAGDNAIITITKSGETTPIQTLALSGGNASVTIKGLPLGEYVIADRGWSHAYTVNTKSQALILDSDKTVTFIYQPASSSPFHAESGKVNWR